MAVSRVADVVLDIDIDVEDKGSLVERFVNTVKDDDEKFLLKLRNIPDRVGTDIPTIEVRYEHPDVEADAISSTSALPNSVNFHINMVEYN